MHRNEEVFLRGKRNYEKKNRRFCHSFTFQKSEEFILSEWPLHFSLIFLSYSPPLPTPVTALATPVLTLAPPPLCHMPVSCSVPPIKHTCFIHPLSKNAFSCLFVFLSLSGSDQPHSMPFTQEVFLTSPACPDLHPQRSFSQDYQHQCLAIIRPLSWGLTLMQLFCLLN